MSSQKECYERNFEFKFYLTFISMLAALFLVLGGSFVYFKSDLAKYMDDEYETLFNQVANRHMQQNTVRQAEIAIYSALNPRNVIDITAPPPRTLGFRQ